MHHPQFPSLFHNILFLYTERLIALAALCAGSLVWGGYNLNVQDNQTLFDKSQIINWTVILLFAFPNCVLFPLAILPLSAHYQYHSSFFSLPILIKITITQTNKSCSCFKNRWQFSQVAPELLANITLSSLPESGWWSCIQLLTWCHLTMPQNVSLHSMPHPCNRPTNSAHSKCWAAIYIQNFQERNARLTNMYLRHIIHLGTHTGHESDLTTELTQNSHIAYSSAKGYQHADQLKTSCDSDLHTYDRRSCCFSVVCSCKTDNGTWTNSPPGKDYKPNRQQPQKKQELFSFGMWQTR